MTINKMESILAGMPPRTHNYDVLLMSRRTDGEPFRFAPGKHVGNERFRVLLSLFRQRYLQAAMFGHLSECASIAEELLDTFSNKCVPNGRIFQRGHDGRWCKQEGYALINIIANALKNEPLQSECVERRPKRVCRRSSELKRPRTTTATKDHVAPPNRFDVVCKADLLGKLSLECDRKHTGNNRLKVIISMRQKSYENSDQEGKQRIVKEIVSSIIDDASGRFLQSDKPSGTYKLVSREWAATCVSKAMNASTEGERGQFRQAEVKKLVQRKHKKAILNRIERRKHRSASLLLALPPTSLDRVEGIAQKVA